MSACAIPRVVARPENRDLAARASHAARRPPPRAGRSSARQPTAARRRPLRAATAPRPRRAPRRARRRAVARREQRRRERDRQAPHRCAGARTRRQRAHAGRWSRQQRARAPEVGSRAQWWQCCLGLPDTTTSARRLTLTHERRAANQYVRCRAGTPPLGGASARCPRACFSKKRRVKSRSVGSRRRRGRDAGCPRRLGWSRRRRGRDTDRPRKRRRVRDGLPSLALSTLPSRPGFDAGRRPARGGRAPGRRGRRGPRSRRALEGPAAMSMIEGGVRRRREPRSACRRRARRGLQTALPRGRHVDVCATTVWGVLAAVSEGRAMCSRSRSRPRWCFTASSGKSNGSRGADAGEACPNPRDAPKKKKRRPVRFGHVERALRHAR